MAYIHFNNNNVIKELDGKSVILFGAGKEGKEFITTFSNHIKIVYFVDNKIKKGEVCALNGVNVYDFSYLMENRNNELIIVTSLVYSEEISQQLIDNGFCANNDFVIWNKYFEDKYDNNVAAFIQHNKKIWGGRDNNKNQSNKILLRHYSWVESIFIDWSYFSNYFAAKYDAEIWAFDFKCNFFNEAIEEIYKSFNVRNNLYLDESLEQKNIAKNLVDDIWPSLHTKEDWLNITVYGQNFGVDILAYYIRSHPEELVENLCTEEFKSYLLRMFMQIVFWEEYLKKDKSVKVILLGDGQYRDGIIRKIAIKNGIAVYSTDQDTRFKWNEYVPGRSYLNYKRFFGGLSKKQKEIGIEWARKKLTQRLNGDISDLYYMKKSAYGNVTEKRILKQNNKVKIMICPHCFGDNPYVYGRFLFSDHWDWLCSLGEISLKTNYDWYLKIHPEATSVDLYYLRILAQRYPTIHLLPKDVSPVQLRNEGMEFALTVWGTIGHEYPFLGIQVINAGLNPHISFEFNWNPKTKEEYTNLLLNLNSEEKKMDINEIYQFYSIHYLFYQRADQSRYSVCYKNKKLIENLRTLNGRTDTMRFEEFLEECSDKRHKEILSNVEKCIRELDEYRDDKCILNKQYMQEIEVGNE